MGDKWELIGKVKSSEWRLKVMKILKENIKLPSELSNEADISSSHISEVLKDLEKMRLIECKNPNLRKIILRLECLWSSLTHQEDQRR